MKTITFEIKDATLEETENMISRTKISREKYFEEALFAYNRIQKRKWLEECLHNDSLLVRKESMRILRDFENL